jgi:hypothetical protein
VNSFQKSAGEWGTKPHSSPLAFFTAAGKVAANRRIMQKELSDNYFNTDVELFFF